MFKVICLWKIEQTYDFGGGIDMYKTYTIIHPFFVGRRAIKALVSSEMVGMKYGPFSTTSEAAKALNLKRASKINEVLKGNLISTEGYTFRYEGKKTYKFQIPSMDVKIENTNLRKHSKETLQQTLTCYGFHVIQIGELKGTATRVTVKCCQVDCEDHCERAYKEFMTDYALPLCKVCIEIFRAHERKMNKTKWLHEVRPDLEVYYKPEHNGHIPFTEIRKGSKEKIFLTCTQCQYVQTAQDATTPNKYTTKKRNGRFSSNFTCSRCNSLLVKFPHIAAEWDEEKNGPLPEHISFASHQQYWWKCANGHSWKISIDSRTNSNTRCLRCFLNERESFAGKLMKEAIRELFPQHRVKVEAMVPGAMYRNDCVVELANGHTLVFEMQGSYWHYTDRKLMEMDGRTTHKDIEKFKANRAAGNLVFLVNEYDFNFGTVDVTKAIMKHAVEHIWQYVQAQNFTVACDVAYNQEKCEQTMRTKQAYYIEQFNERYDQTLPQRLDRTTMKYVTFQHRYEIYEQAATYM